MTSTISTYSENIPWFFRSDTNSSSQEEIVIAPSRFNVYHENPETIKEYLQNLPDYENQHNKQNGTWSDSQVVVVTRVRDNNQETEGEWKIFAEPKVINANSNSSLETMFENHSDNGLDYLIEPDDIQKYLNNYHELLFTFKDFVKIGANPYIKEKISRKDWNQDNGKTFNVTYVMPVPKTKQYFEIKLSNLTNTQYYEINLILQEYLAKKIHENEMSKSKVQDIFYVDVDTMSNKLISQALSIPLNSNNGTVNSTTENISVNKEFPREAKPAETYFERLFTPEGFNDFLIYFNSNLSHLNYKSANHTVFQRNNTSSNVLKNNGFHAVIATDYDEEFGKETKYRAQEDLIQKTNYIHETIPKTEKLEEVEQSIFNAQPRRNKTELLLETPSKKSLINLPDFDLNRTGIIKPIKGQFQKQPIHAFSTPNANKMNTSYYTTDGSKNLEQSREKGSNSKSENRYHNDSTTMKREKDEIVTPKTTSVNNKGQELGSINKLYNSLLTKPTTESFISSHSLSEKNEVPDRFKDNYFNSKLFNVIEAAKWLIETKKKVDEDDRKKTERHKNYIKKFLRVEESTIPENVEDGNIMKINKQENILEELKQLMLDYFTSLNFQNQKSINNTSAVQSIRKTKNIFELMEESSNLAKLNLQTKLQSENKEPISFAKRIAEKQVQKCRNIFKNTNFSNPNRNFSDLFNTKNNKKFMAFTKCINFKLERCIKGFSLWLEKGKFFSRSQFKLERAYEHYEIERNLYCLRNYNPSSLDSNHHSIKVKLGQKLNRKSETGKMRTDYKLRFQVKKNNKGSPSTEKMPHRNRQTGSRLNSNSIKARKASDRSQEIKP